MSKRRAILVGNGNYPEDDEIVPLHGPANDVRLLKELLVNPEIGGYDEVLDYIDADSKTVGSVIEDILLTSQRGDHVLIYYSGHGMLDPRGQLCLSTRDTRLKSLRTTSLHFPVLSTIIDDSPSESIVVLLDSCYSGAAEKAFVRSGVQEQIRLMAGAGRHILTASTAIHTAREREVEEAGIILGEFSRMVIHGIETGNADIDGDGFVSVRDLAEYVQREVRGQRPQHWGFRTDGQIIIAKTKIVPPQEKILEVERTPPPHEESLPLREDVLQQIPNPQHPTIVITSEISSLTTWQQRIKARLSDVQRRIRDTADYRSCRRLHLGEIGIHLFRFAATAILLAVPAALVGRIVWGLLASWVPSTSPLLKGAGTFLASLFVLVLELRKGPKLPLPILEGLLEDVRRRRATTEKRVRGSRLGIELYWLEILNDSLPGLWREPERTLSRLLEDLRNRLARDRQDTAVLIADCSKLKTSLNFEIAALEKLKNEVAAYQSAGRSDLANMALANARQRERNVELGQVRLNRSNKEQEIARRWLRYLLVVVEELQARRNSIRARGRSQFARGDDDEVTRDVDAILQVMWSAREFEQNCLDVLRMKSTVSV